MVQLSVGVLGGLQCNKSVEPNSCCFLQANCHACYKIRVSSIRYFQVKCYAALLIAINVKHLLTFGHIPWLLNTQVTWHRSVLDYHSYDLDQVRCCRVRLFITPWFLSGCGKGGLGTFPVVRRFATTQSYQPALSISTLSYYSNREVRNNCRGVTNKIVQSEINHNCIWKPFK